MPRKIISEELKQDIIKYYLSKSMTIKNVSKKYDLSNPTVIKILKDINKYPKARIYNSELKENFFEKIESEEAAYFLGLIISDGNVFHTDSGNRQDSISITLDLKDGYMLEKFKEVLHANTSVTKDGRGCGQIAVRSNVMSKDLSKYGIVPRKSFLTYLPKNIDKKYMNHLIRGILDGDGSIQAKQGRTSFLHSISFCGTHQLMSDISDYICSELKLIKKPIVYDYKNRILSEIKILNYNDIKIFGDWLYSNATIYLERKHNNYLEIIKHYNKAIPS